jgi:hypothetical protein
MTNPTYETFQRDVAEHELRILHDDGIYRHVQGRRKSGSSAMHFNVVTFPGYLAYTGDCGAFTFWRTTDMFTFFRTKDPSQINPHYWAQKLEATRRTDGFKEFSHESLTSHCWDYMRQFQGDFDAKKRGEIGQAIIDEVLCADSLEDAHERLRDFEVDGEQFFSDSWEWDLTDYTARFIWCCYAIVWAIARYDEQKGQST